MLFATAHYILDHFKAGGMSHIKLQKLVYLSFGFYAAYNKGAYLFPNEIQAWDFGPAIPDLYYKAKPFFPQKDAIYPVARLQQQTEGELTPAHREAIDFALRIYGRETAKDLTRFTHMPQTLWSRYYKEGVRDIVIPREEIATYYRKAVLLAKELNRFRDAFIALSKT